jgi:glycosyltransferase involved in cell wall biosynthesis
MAGQRPQQQMNRVDVSVVMSVFNGADSLPPTLDSVLNQQGCRFEFIVINDGSTDATQRILDARAARDARLRVIHQANTGLTRALVRGCEMAQGEFIARQDCGDLSMPGRLERQCLYLQEHPEAALVACAARFIGPADEPLFVTARIGAELHEGLSALNLHLKGPPHHGGTMFPRRAYLKAGGYRPFFPVAQDIDLWLRLRELGRCVGEADVGYEARMEAGSISARRRTEQIHFADLATQCARLRSEGLGDSQLVDGHTLLSFGTTRRNEKLERAKFLYFIGSCLRQTDPAAARRYFWKAFQAHPLLVKSLIRFALG